MNADCKQPIMKLNNTNTVNMGYWYYLPLTHTVSQLSLQKKKTKIKYVYQENFGQQGLCTEGDINGKSG